jgi:hypothetical protein
MSFDWGTDTSYTGGNIAGNPASITGVPTVFTASLSGLTAGTTYHYRAQAVTGATTVYGNDQTFTTLASIPTLTINTNDLPSGTVSLAYSQNLAATGGTAPYAWALTSGTLPAGLTLSSDGVISGKPIVTSGPVRVTFQVTDSTGLTATKSISITIDVMPNLASVYQN